MGDMVNITINGMQMQAQKGSLLIDKLLDENIHIPHFCYHQALGKDGNCRMCMVEIEGQKRPQIACDTPIKDGMIVKTKGQNIEKVRKDILELELINHPIDCPTCDQAGECKLQDYYMESGFYESRINLDSKNHARKRVDLGSNVMLDQERCVLCKRCVRFCSDITKTNELGVITRSDHSVIATFPGYPLNNPYAMNVVDLCPVGALTSKDFRFKQRVWFLESFEAICNGCAKGCNIHVDHRKEKYKDDQIYRFRPRVNKNINGWFICDEGRLSYTKENENRFENILIEKNISDLETSLKIFVDRLKTDKTIFLLGANLSLEELQKISNFANKYNITLSGYSPNTIDENFGDDYLKNCDKTANRKGFELYNINQTKEYFENALNSAKFIGIFDNNFFDENIDLLKNKYVISLFSHNNQTINNSNIAIPITSFYEKSGTYINCDNIKQKVISKMNKDSTNIDINLFIEQTINLLEKGVL